MAGFNASVLQALYKTTARLMITVREGLDVGTIHKATVTNDMAEVISTICFASGKIGLDHAEILNLAEQKFNKLKEGK